MSLENWFWAIYVIALLFGVWSSYEANQPLWYRRAGSYVALWILVGILGYGVFGLRGKGALGGSMLIILIILIILFAGGGHFYNDGAYRGPGFGLGGLCLLLLVLYLLHII